VGGFHSDDSFFFFGGQQASLPVVANKGIKAMVLRIGGNSNGSNHFRSLIWEAQENGQSDPSAPPIIPQFAPACWGVKTYSKSLLRKKSRKDAYLWLASTQGASKFWDWISKTKKSVHGHRCLKKDKRRIPFPLLHPEYKIVSIPKPSS